MQTMTQTPTNTSLLLLIPLTMFLEMCMQTHSVVFVDKSTSKKYAKPINLLCTGNKVL